MRSSAGVTVNFMASSYSVTEGEGKVRVCVQMLGFSTIPLTVTLSTAQDTARGRDTKVIVWVWSCGCGCVEW